MNSCYADVRNRVSNSMANPNDARHCASSENSFNLNSDEMQRLQSFMRDSSQGTSGKTPPSVQMLVSSRDKMSMSGSFNT